MPDLNFFMLNLNGSNDDLALKYLAGSLLQHWSELPNSLRDSIYERAIEGNIVGLAPANQIKKQIDDLLDRNISERRNDLD